MRSAGPDSPAEARLSKRAWMAGCRRLGQDDGHQEGEGAEGGEGSHEVLSHEPRPRRERGKRTPPTCKPPVGGTQQSIAPTQEMLHVGGDGCLTASFPGRLRAVSS